MTVQFRRAFVAEFGTVKIACLSGETTLRVKFSVERDKLPWPNSAELAVWNLNADTRAKLTQGGAVVAKIQAGYQGDVQQIFYGLLDIVEHEQESDGSWVTHMSSSDCGEKIKQARVTTSYVKGATVLTVIKGILKAIGLGEGNLSAFAKEPALTRTLSHGGGLHGNAVEELTYFLRSAGLEFSIQDGKLQFLKIGSGAPNTSGPLINAAHGMIGSPKLVREKTTDLTKKKTKKTVANTIVTAFGEQVDLITTVEAKCLLTPSLVPGVPFRIESESVNGDFLACATKSYGDSSSQDWYTEVKGIPFDDV